MAKLVVNEIIQLQAGFSQNSDLGNFMEMAGTWFEDCREALNKPINKYESLLNSIGFFFEKLPEPTVRDLSLKFLNELNEKVKIVENKLIEMP